MHTLQPPTPLGRGFFYGGGKVNTESGLAVTVVKAAPPVAYFSGTTLFGFEISHLIGWMTLMYTLLLLLDKAFPSWRATLVNSVTSAVTAWRK